MPHSKFKAHSEFEVRQFEAKLELHKSQATLQNLKADSFRTLAASHACMSDSHCLNAQRYRSKLEADSDSALRLHYELKTRYHMLQAEQHWECFTCYRRLAIEHGKKAKAHEMLCDYLQSKVAKKQPVGEAQSLPTPTGGTQETSSEVNPVWC